MRMKEINFQLFGFSSTGSTQSDHYKESQAHVKNPIMSFSCILSFNPDITLYTVDLASQEMSSVDSKGLENVC
jgi:hypothetical protein